MPERLVADRPIRLIADQYSSSNACQRCHPDHYATWRRSYHRTMTQIATPDTLVASFADVRVDQTPGRPMFLRQRGRELWAEFDDPDWNGKGDAPSRIERQVVLTTGSHNQQIYWYATGHDRLLGQLPAIQLVGERRWIPRRSAVMHPPGDATYSETGAWNGICVACHTTSGRPEFDTPFGSQPVAAQRVDTKAVEFGIACEACHGPGEPHVRINRSPLRRYALHLTSGADNTIVQPLRLDPKRASQVCGQCHSSWEFYDRAGERQANTHGLPFRPGDELTATRFIVQPTRNLGSPTMAALLQDDPRFVSDIFWSDGMVRATGREYNGLLDSPCYKDAREPQRTLTCFSCHTMHEPGDDPRPVSQWADDQLSPRGLGDDACLQCHATYRSNVSAHTNHRPGSTGSSCYNCHMPLHDLRSAEDDPQPSNQQSVGQRDGGHRPSERVQPVPSRQDAGVDVRRSHALVRSGSDAAVRRGPDGCRVASDSSQRRRGAARDRRAEHGVAAGAAGLGRQLDRRRTWRCS